MVAQGRGPRDQGNRSHPPITRGKVIHAFTQQMPATAINEPLETENCETRNSTKPKGLTGAKVVKAAGLVNYQDVSIVSREIVKKPTGSVTLFAFDEGQGLSEHTAPFDALVQVVEGAAETMISGQPHQLPGGEMILMPAGQPHAL